MKMNEFSEKLNNIKNTIKETLYDFKVCRGNSSYLTRNSQSARYCKEEAKSVEFHWLSTLSREGRTGGGLWHDSRTKKITNHGSRILKFHFPESRK